ncbi:MAG: hypothetical protein AAFN30_12920 [Actinomycetota bacterium]
MNGTCDSCGRDDEPTTVVRRLYVTPAAWDAEAKVTRAPETEQWCAVCQTHYAHEAP